MDRCRELPLGPGRRRRDRPGHGLGPAVHGGPTARGGPLREEGRGRFLPARGAGTWLPSGRGPAGPWARGQSAPSRAPAAPGPRTDARSSPPLQAWAALASPCSRGPPTAVPQPLLLHAALHAHCSSVCESLVPPSHGQAPAPASRCGSGASASRKASLTAGPAAFHSACAWGCCPGPAPPHPSLGLSQGAPPPAPACVLLAQGTLPVPFPPV